MNKVNASFTREDTRVVKGVAVIMMLLHHLAGFNYRFPVGFDGFKSHNDWFINEGFLENLALNMKFCVGVFFFLGGYGIYKSIQKGHFSLTNSVVGLFKKYWKIFIIFIPVALIFFKRSGEEVSMLASRYNFANIREIITNVFANFTMLSDSLNSEWWFMRTYICVLIMGTVYFKFTKKLNSFSGELLIVFLLDMLFRSVFPNLSSIHGLEGLSSNIFFIRFCYETVLARPVFCRYCFCKIRCYCKIEKNVL